MMMQRGQYSENGFYFNAIRRLPYAALKVPEAPAPPAVGPLNSGALTDYVASNRLVDPRGIRSAG